MPHLDCTLRNDCLRVALAELPADVQAAEQLNVEFSELLSRSPGCKAVIVDLFAQVGATAQVAGMLQRWQGLATATGRKFRLNGVSDVVARLGLALRGDELRAMAG